MESAKILVVDSDAGDYEPLKPGLAKHGYDIHTVTAAPKALQLAGAYTYQVALISLTLLCDDPLLPGLRAEFPHLPIIAILSPDIHYIPAQVAAIVDNSLGKPLSLDLVRLMLDRTLELVLLRSRLRQQRQSWWHDLDQQLFPDQPPSLSQPPSTPLDELLVDKLRPMISSMESVGYGSLHRMVLSYVEKLLLTVVLTECRGNQVKSASILGINRNTLRKKMHELNITLPRRSA